MGEDSARHGSRSGWPSQPLLCRQRSAQEVFGVGSTDRQMARLLTPDFFFSVEDLLLLMLPSGHHLRTIRSKC